jgi:hypothetical protein
MVDKMVGQEWLTYCDSCGAEITRANKYYGKFWIYEGPMPSERFDVCTECTVRIRKLAKFPKVKRKV